MILYSSCIILHLPFVEATTDGSFYSTSIVGRSMGVYSGNAYLAPADSSYIVDDDDDDVR